MGSECNACWHWTRIADVSHPHLFDSFLASIETISSFECLAVLKRWFVVQNREWKRNLVSILFLLKTMSCDTHLFWDGESSRQSVSRFTRCLKLGCKCLDMNAFNQSRFGLCSSESNFLFTSPGQTFELTSATCHESAHCRAACHFPGTRWLRRRSFSLPRKYVFASALFLCLRKYGLRWFFPLNCTMKRAP